MSQGCISVEGSVAESSRGAHSTHNLRWPGVSQMQSSESEAWGDPTAGGGTQDPKYTAPGASLRGEPRGSSPASSS